MVSGFAGLALTFALTFFLTPVVAIHFNLAGQPDGWASKWTNAALFAGLFLFINILYGGLPWLLRKIPVAYINIPNREYWFAPERKEESLARVGAFLSELAVFTNIFFIGIELILFYANRMNKPAPSIAFFSLLAGILVFIILWVVHLIRAFRLPKAGG